LGCLLSLVPPIKRYLPYIEEFEDPSKKTLVCGPYEEKAAGTRVVENFTDYVFMVVSRNYGFAVSDADFMKFQDTVFEQDKWIIETQKPELLLLDLQMELNDKADLLSVAYRRWL